jgi:hypothetical protein
MAQCVRVEMNTYRSAKDVGSGPITQLVYTVRNIIFSVGTIFVASTAVMYVMVTMIVVMVRMRTQELEEYVVK